MFEYTMNDQYSLMLWRQAITISMEFMDELITELHRIEKIHPPFNRFVDLTDALGIELHFRDLRRISEMRREYQGPPVKSAFYSSHPLGFGIGRMYEVLMQGKNVEVNVFDDLNECADWLEVPVEVLDIGPARSAETE
jgi:hypothetical protein